MTKFTGRETWTAHLNRSTVKRKLSATASAPKRWALISGQISRPCTNMKKVLAAIFYLSNCKSTLD